MNIYVFVIISLIFTLRFFYLFNLLEKSVNITFFKKTQRLKRKKTNEKKKVSEILQFGASSFLYNCPKPTMLTNTHNNAIIAL